ncbi:MAG: ABC transporter permease [Coriobacteriales bacterium]|jgi:ABC-type dipeptide/oligopeptide/nickel transport system permease component|nr:ABC transporter permease [Coriobacteriales bacterium]
MAQYIIRRILQFIPVFIGVTLLLFTLRAIVPGDPVRMIAGEKAIPEETYNQIVEAHHLNEPIYVQYGYYMGDLLQGNLGTSYQRGMQVTDIFLQKFPYTAQLALCAILIEVIIGIAVGIISAVKRYSWIDVLVTLSTSILVSLPVFWFGMMLQYLFGLILKDLTGGAVFLPISGAPGPTNLLAPWMYYILPAITLASVSLAYTARIMRSQLLEVMNQDYIRTAFAKGLSKRAVIVKHALKNAMIPVITFIGIDFGVMMSGAILTETIFNWPGIGYEIYRAILQRDWPIVMGGVILIVIVVMVINLLIDISYALFDPRIRYGKQKGGD